MWGGPHSRRRRRADDGKLPLDASQRSENVQDRARSNPISTGTSPSVAILLATFNGARHLQDQLASISAQTYQGWHLIAADDGSEDNTLAILEQFSDQHPGRVSLLNGPSTGSARDNFLHVLEHAPHAAYYAFCDQDDVWKPQKLALLVEACQQVENETSSDTPCAVYSDLAVVDENLEVLAPSFMEHIAVDPLGISLGSLLVENSIPGCAMLFNDCLRSTFSKYAGPFDDVVMHDWWIALIAKALGRLDFVNAPLVAYRQHATNALGAVQRRGLRFILGKLTVANPEIHGALRQGRLFASAFGCLTTGSATATLADMASLSGKSKLQRIRIYIRSGILKQSLGRRIYQFLSG